MKHSAAHAEGEVPAASTLRRYVYRIAFAKEYFLLAGLLVFVVAGLSLVTFSGVEVLSAVRAYTNAEALYSKAQKDAVYYLHQYAVSGQEEYYRKYESAIAVPLGYRQARVELEKAHPDPARIRAGMLQGKSDPQDADVGPISVWTYRLLRKVGPATRAIRLWHEADLLVGQLQNVAALVHHEVASGTPDPDRLAGLLQEVERINVNLTTLEEAFSQTLGAAAHWVRRFVLLSIGVAALLLLWLGLLPSWGMLRRLKSSEEKFRRLFEQSRDAIVLVTLSGRMVYANPAAFSFFGYPASKRNQVGGLSVTEHFVHDDERAALLEALHTDGFVQNFECRLRRLDDSEFDAVITSTLIRDRSGRVIGFESILRDVTETKQAEEALRNALAKERELSELQARFVSMASHEFRTPLATILSSAELLERFRHRWDDSQTMKHLRRIQNSVSALTDLLENVLLVGKVKAGQMRFEASEVELKSFCKDLIDEVWLARGDSRHLEVTLPPSPMPVLADPNLLRSLLSNLLTNAAKYTEPGEEISFRLERDGERAIFRVSDDGIGIPKDELAHVVKPFHRAHNVETIPGTGLGLSIAKRAVELHGGTLRIESEEGGGTTVVVSIPLVVEQVEPTVHV